MFENLIQISNKISENKYCSALKKSFINSMPIILIGALILVITNMPIPGFNEFFVRILGENWSGIISLFPQATINLITLYIALQTIINLSLDSDVFKQNFVDLNISLIVCFSGMLFMLWPEEAETVFEILSPVSLFRAMIYSVLSVKLFEFSINHSPVKPTSFGNEYEDLDTRKTINTIIPALITFLLLIFIKIFVSMPLFDFINNHIMDNYIAVFAEKYNDTLGVALLFIFSMHIMWFFGMHGTNILEPITMLIYDTNASQNAELISMGLDPQFIFSRPFFNSFVFMGGSGCTLALVIAILLFGRNTTIGKFVKSSGFISLFNINELVIYGLPIIFNPVYLIPFIGVPIILTIISYIAFATGLVPLVNNPDIMWTCPIILGGYYATGSIAGVVLQIVNLIIGTACYAPFVKIAQRIKLENSKQMMKNLMEEFSVKKYSKDFKINRNSSEGMMAEILANDIKKGIKNEEFYLIYQPLVLKDKIVGAEALLRWNHPVYGEISPIIILMLASEYGYLQDITKWIISTVFRQSKRWTNMQSLGDLDVAENFKVSMNMSFDQLNCFDWVSYVSELIWTEQVNPKNIEIEISEEVAFDRSEYNLNMINGLLALGFDLSIDNFGMGYSSLVYLCAFKISEVKIDGDIIQAVIDNPKSVEIVRSIFEMCKNMDIRCVAKMPERAEQLEILNHLGMIIYQGYYYSKPLIPSEFEKFVQSHKFSEEIFDDMITDENNTEDTK